MVVTSPIGALNAINCPDIEYTAIGEIASTTVISPFLANMIA